MLSSLDGAKQNVMLKIRFGIACRQRGTLGAHSLASIWRFLVYFIFAAGKGYSLPCLSGHYLTFSRLFYFFLQEKAFIRLHVCLFPRAAGQSYEGLAAERVEAATVHLSMFSMSSEWSATVSRDTLHNALAPSVLVNIWTTCECTLNVIYSARFCNRLFRGDYLCVVWGLCDGNCEVQQSCCMSLQQHGYFIRVTLHRRSALFGNGHVSHLLSRSFVHDQPLPKILVIVALFQASCDFYFYRYRFLDFGVPWTRNGWIANYTSDFRDSRTTVSNL